MSVWEVLLLAKKKRIILDREPMAWVEASVERLRLGILPITIEIAMETNNIDTFERQDPGDRFIVATARVHQLTLLTADEWILRWPGVRTLWL
jgi:PIN domain nuclease of toxin-antitoxin system